MAGSYSHCVDDQGRLLPPEELCSMLECTSGDVYEAIEEMYGMIWYLARGSAQEVEWARKFSGDGIATFSPGLSDGN